MDRKIAFFDIDGTLTSEIDGSIPSSVYTSIKEARNRGNLMFINTGRCMQNVENRFREIGFDGYVCGCGTNIYVYDESSKLNELLHVEQPSSVITNILKEARKYKLDILFESKFGVVFDRSHDFFSEDARRQYNHFLQRNYDMDVNIESPDFNCDKFVIWFNDLNDIDSFRKYSDLYFECINRGGNFREFVPHGYSKATGIQFILDYYDLSIENSYAFGDSNNDLSMLSYAKNSVAMGNSFPESLFSQVSYITSKSSENGIHDALKHFNFID